MSDISFSQVISLSKGQDVTELEETNRPYYLLAKEGVFLSKPTILGRAFLHTDKMPPSLGEVGDKVGYFDWNVDKIPANICAQIVSFFRRIYKEHQTEAEVLLTLHKDTKEWRVFIPTQKVSATAVESVYEPEHIDSNYLVVGTMHSHCNFGAFHSGTDIADAAQMDGVHFTIGMLQQKIPQVANMVSMSGTRFTYKDASSLADFSDLECDTAPTWWDRYVIPTSNLASTHKPVGYEGFEKYKPKTTYEPKGPYYSSPYSPPAGDTRPPAFGGNTLPVISSPTIGDYLNSKNPKEILSDDELETLELKEMLYEQDKRRHRELSDDSTRYEDWLKRAAGTVYWEDVTPADAREAILDSELLTDDDFDLANDLGDKADLNFFRKMFVNKIAIAEEVLTRLGKIMAEESKTTPKQTRSRRKRK